RLIHADAGVVDENIQSAKSLHSMLNKRKAGRLPANIGLEKIHAAFSCDVCRHTAPAYRIAVDKCHLGPLGDEAPHGGFSDTGRPTGHGSDHSIQLSHWRSSSIRLIRAYEAQRARYKNKLTGSGERVARVRP